MRSPHYGEHATCTRPRHAQPPVADPRDTPPTCMALARSCVTILDARGDRGMRFAVVTSVVLCALVTTWALHPVWTGQPIPYSTWLLRMWLQTWI